MSERILADRELLNLIERCEKVQRDFGTAHAIPALDAAVEYLVRLRERIHATREGGAGKELR